MDVPTTPTPKMLRFAAGNYVNRVDGACYVQLGEAVVYFAGEKLIALASKNVLYRINDLDSGIIYKRLRAALMRHQANSRVHQVSRADLQSLVEAAIMTLASNLVDDKMK